MNENEEILKNNKKCAIFEEEKAKLLIDNIILENLPNIKKLIKKNVSLFNVVNYNYFYENASFEDSLCQAFYLPLFFLYEVENIETAFEIIDIEIKEKNINLQKKIDENKNIINKMISSLNNYDNSMTFLNFLKKIEQKYNVTIFNIDEIVNNDKIHLSYLKYELIKEYIKENKHFNCPLKKRTYMNYKENFKEFKRCENRTADYYYYSFLSSFLNDFKPINEVLKYNENMEMLFRNNIESVMPFIIFYNKDIFNIDEITTASNLLELINNYFKDEKVIATINKYNQDEKLNMQKKQTNITAFLENILLSNITSIKNNDKIKKL